MLKKIPVSELSLGMHIHKFCRPWNSDPFWVAHVETDLHDNDVLKRIQSSDTLEVWIDTQQGRDHTPQPTPASAHDDTAAPAWNRRSSAPEPFAARPAMS